jgi:hypothetical protein
MAARLQVHSLSLLPGKFSSNAIEHIFYECLRERFAYSVLSPETLEALAEHAPFVELGAGNGYNAWLLQQAGLEVIPLEAFPIEEGSNWFFNTRFGLPTRSGRSWTRVLKGDSDSLRDYVNYSLLLCWPPRTNMALASLSHFAGNKLVFIGDKKTCANSSFYTRLTEGWHAIYAARTNTWIPCQDEILEVYVRN